MLDVPIVLLADIFDELALEQGGMSGKAPGLGEGLGILEGGFV